MNLNAYDNIKPTLDKQKTWVCPIHHILYSREIAKRKYAVLSKRFEPKTNNTNYYVIMLDEYPKDRNISKSCVDSFGRLKINITIIWNETSLKYIKTKSNINIEHIEHTDDGDIYYLDI